ncbi:MAG TPA: GNAT family N-acetyltransferase [Acidobacteriaceae bacterium]|jgi:RimJ/RimL family protein N-acetyltransferase|nr:GNAT family N-acetyltransferase [Acidobacteriaceae bacterium]
MGLLRRTPDLKTARLRLVAITPAMLKADEAADGTLGNILGAEVTAEWPPEHWEPHVHRFIVKQFEDEPQTRGWHRYVLLPRRDEDGRGYVLIGAVGAFPKFEGDAEIGYSTVPAYQRCGYATEAAKALVEWLLRQKGVRSVSAQTYPRLPESIKVMERCGMTFVGVGDEAGTVRYRRMR